MFVLLSHLRRSDATSRCRPRAARGSLALRHVDAGSCNGCEHELTATANPYYDLQRYGLDIVASPRHADVLLVTGAITTRMREPLLAAYDAMPEPRLVAALGNCALGCDLLGDPAQLAGPLEADPAGRPAHPRLPARPQQIADALLGLMREVAEHPTSRPIFTKGPQHPSSRRCRGAHRPDKGVKDA